MPQSFAQMNVHLIFSTKGREPIIFDSVREDLHKYMATVLQNAKCPPVLINSVEDHIHLLFCLGRTMSISEAVEHVKTTSSKWMKLQDTKLSSFAWQAGYGAFSVSQSNVGAVRQYIENQQVHHQKVSFQAEFRRFLKEHALAFDERYVWD